MKIKITCPFGEYQAGLIYGVPDEEAQEAIKNECAFEVKDEEAPRPVEIKKAKKVKHDDG